MRAKCLWLVAVVALTASGTLQGGGGKDGADVLKKIQGTWKFTSMEMDGKAMPKEDVGKHTVTFAGDKWTVRVDDKVVQAGTHKFDPSKKPAQVDAVVKEGEGKGTTMLGIYEFKGDTMRVCFDPMGKERPTDFSSKNGRMLASVERQKKKTD